MNILFVTDLCPINKEEWGIPLTLLNFVLDFKKLGHNVTVLRPNVVLNVLIRKRKILPEGEYKYKGIKCINKNFITPFFSEKQFEFLKKQKFDVILSHMPSGVLAANKISKLLKIPYYASVHASDIEVLTNPIYAFLWHSIKKAYKEAKLVLPRSYWLKDKIEEIIPSQKGKTYIIPSGIEEKFYIKKEKINKKAQNIFSLPLKVFAAGSLIERKNFSNLIKAVSKFDDVDLIIAGGGKEKDKLLKLTKKLKLQNRVFFTGKRGREEILNLMEKTSVFILPSLKETFGMVYLEAMAKGSIVICSKNSGMAGFIKHGYNGFLVKPSVKGIKNIIDKIKTLKNPETIMDNALDTALSMERLKMSENYINIIQNILV